MRRRDMMSDCYEAEEGKGVLRGPPAMGEEKGVSNCLEI
jgi:hypothetical protein